MVISDELLALCKQAARISESFDDELIKFYIQSGLAHYTAYTGRHLEQRTERYTLGVDERGYVHLPTAPTQGTDVIINTGSVRRRIPVFSSGQRYLEVPRNTEEFFTCGPTRVNVEYTIGPRTCDLPYPVVSGLMRYVSYCYEHRGDDLALINTRNNGPISASGALDEWRSQIPMMMD